MSSGWVGRGKVRAREVANGAEIAIDGVTTQARYYKPLVYEFFRKEFAIRPRWGEFEVELMMEYVGETPTLDLDNLAKALLDALKGHIFFDDSQTPQAQGTGTEEWGGGGDYWGGRNMTLPLAGHPVGVRRPEDAKVPEDKIHSAYRFLLADLMPFGKNARIQFEHGGTNLSTEHYETVTYWYGLPAASLVRTDQLKVGDLESERAHGYVSPNASEVYELTSRYELGPDTLERLWPNLPPVSGEGREVYPAHKDSGRYTTGVSEFNVKLDRNNLGVLLRRKLDYSLANQRAEVYIGPPDAKEGDWKAAGIWYLAG